MMKIYITCKLTRSHPSSLFKWSISTFLWGCSHKCFGLAHGIGCQTLVIDNNRLLAVISLLQSIYLEYYRKQTLVYYVCFLFWYLPCVYFALLAHSTKTKLVESENFSSGALHFDPKHRTFNIVSIVCIVSNFLSFVWFATSIVWNDGKKKFKAFRRFQRFRAFLSLYFAWEN